MFDIHTHLLPGVDDGVRDMNECLKIFQSYMEQGIKGVVLTPHYAPRRGYTETKAVYKEKFEQLKKALVKEGITTKIYLGNEIDEGNRLQELIQSAHSINQKGFVLIDFSARIADIEEIVYELSVYHYKVIVAHAERYDYMKIKDWKKVKKMGGIIQVNANKVIKNGNAKTSYKRAQKLLKEDLVDVIASDIHSISEVGVLKKAYDHVAKKKGMAYAQKLFVDNPKAIIGI